MSTTQAKFVQAWREWGQRVLLDHEEQYDTEAKRWLRMGGRNLGRNRWSPEVLPPNGRVMLAPERVTLAHGIASPPRKKRVTPKRKPLKRWLYALDDWPPMDRDHSMHCDPRRLGITEEPLLWWEAEEAWEPEGGVLSEFEVIRAKSLCGRYAA